MRITFEDVKNNKVVQTYIKKADESLSALGYTEHSFPHVSRVAFVARDILLTLGYDKREAELAQIAGYLHDIGTLVNRKDHSQSGAVMAWSMLNDMGCDPGEMATIVTAIGNHDEGTGQPVNAVAAALILADKSDVRRSRVRNTDLTTFDIHDRVNYAVVMSGVSFSEDKKTLILELQIDTEISSVMEYFEIFMNRMILCKRASAFLGLKFELIINGSKIL